MQRHVNLLGLLYLLGGGLSLLVAASLVILGLGAFVMTWTAPGENTRMAAALTGTAFSVVAVLIALWGAANALAGRALRRGAPKARLACLALAVLNMFLLPFGTALSVYTMWILMQQDAKRHFEADQTTRRVAGV
jgi:hypothetical protein